MPSPLTLLKLEQLKAKKTKIKEMTQRKEDDNNNNQGSKETKDSSKTPKIHREFYANLSNPKIFPVIAMAMIIHRTLCVLVLQIFYRFFPGPKSKPAEGCGGKTAAGYLALAAVAAVAQVKDGFNIVNKSDPDSTLPDVKQGISVSDINWQSL